MLHYVAGELKEIDLQKLDFQETKEILNRLVRSVESNEEFLQKLKNRIDRFRNRSPFFYFVRFQIESVLCILFAVGIIDCSLYFLVRVSLRLPTIEVRFQNLNVDAEAYLGGTASPTIFSYFLNLAQVNIVYVDVNRNVTVSILISQKYCRSIFFFVGELKEKLKNHKNI